MEIILDQPTINNGPLAFQLNSSGLSTMGNCQVLQPVNDGYNPLNDVRDDYSKLLKQQNATDGVFPHWFSTDNYDDGGDLIVHEEYEAD